MSIQSDRAALALEALADDYRKNFLYGEALRIEDDLMTQFSGQLKRGFSSQAMQVDNDTIQLFMGILALLTYLYEIPAGACLGYLILQTFCLILQISSRNPVFTRSLLRICTEGEARCRPNSHL